MQVFTKTVFILCTALPLLAAAQNTPPTANAGSSRRVVYPEASSTVLSGSGSDKEGPVTFKWAQASGPNKATFATPTQPSTTVSNLKLGVYRFVLTATDNSSVSKTDTTTVSVLQRITWMVGNSEREIVVHRPEGGTGAPPVIIAFHGHGGRDTGFAEKCFELSWPEAVVVYPQGLRTKGTEDLNCKQPGWQRAVGEVNCITGVKDQDLKFFDAILKKISNKYNADLSLVFVHGWSNGAEFVYNALWPARADKLAAIAPAGAALDSIIGISGKKPKPVMHIAGTSDEKTDFSRQQETVTKVRTLNQCVATGTQWAKGSGGLLGTRYASPINDPVVFLQYTGPHRYPYSVPPLIVKFFKEVIASKTTATFITKAPASPASDNNEKSSRLAAR